MHKHCTLHSLVLTDPQEHPATLAHMAALYTEEDSRVQLLLLSLSPKPQGSNLN